MYHRKRRTVRINTFNYYNNISEDATHVKEIIEALILIWSVNYKIFK